MRPRAAEKPADALFRLRLASQKRAVRVSHAFPGKKSGRNSTQELAIIGLRAYQPTMRCWRPVNC